MATKNLSVSIMERFMEDAEIQAFMSRYNSNKKSVGGFGSDRFTFISIIPTDKEKQMLEDYLNDTQRSTKELAEFYGLPVSKFRDTAYNTAIRLAYQASKSGISGS